MPRPRLSLLLASLLGLSGAALATPGYRIEPVPAWVEVQEFDPNAAPDARSGDGTYDLLIDTQTRIGEGEEARYSRIVTKVLDESGVETAGQFGIDFDPEYESLAIHRIDVYRDGQRLDRLEANHLQIIRREAELESQLYDGRLTAHAVLEDVRAGDIVAYSFTVYGANPIFADKYSDSFYTRYPVPVDRFRNRVTAPSSRPMHTKSFGGAPTAEAVQVGDTTVYLWAADHVPARLHDGDTPEWYEPYPWAQVSEWRSWGEVVDWALPLYQADPAALAREAAALSSRHETNEERVVAALRFVQDEVRYVGFEMGRGSHEPRPPARVLQQRFGDCKDKSLLLVSLLEALSIRAFPALVDTTQGRSLSNWLPSPLAFDHVIVLVDLPERRLWVDPSLKYQRGDVDHLHQPDFGFALVVKEGASDLVAMEPGELDGPNMEIREVIDAKSGVGEPATFTVRSTYSGELADQMRDYFASQSAAELQKSFLNYYAPAYPDLEAVSPANITSDDRRNRVVVEESYVLPSFWESAGNYGSFRAEIYPLETGSFLTPPSTTVRTMPLAVEHPYHVIQTTEVLLPEPWPIEESSKTIENDWASFHYSVDRAGDGVLKATYTYRSKADHVPVAAAADYLDDLEAMSDLLGYELSDYRAFGATLNWPLATVAVFAFVIGAFLAWKLYRYEPARPMKPIEPGTEHLEGLGGWLALVGLGVLLSPFGFLAELWGILSAATPETWNTLTNPSQEAFHPLWAPIFLFETTANALMLAFSLVFAALFLKRRASFPVVYGRYLVLLALFCLIDLALVSSIPDAEVTARDASSAVWGAAVAVVWAAYLRVSKRAARTFTKRLGETEERTMVVDTPAAEESAL